MNETAVYSLLTALILLCYLIALRCRKIMRDVECMHDFVHMLADHPILGMVLTHRLHEDHEKPDDQEVPPAFKQWDES
jgi:hypothetical protein